MASLLFALRATSALSMSALIFGMMAAYFSSATNLGFTCFIGAGIVFIFSHGANLYLEGDPR